MKIDLCKLFGVEEGEEFNFNKDEEFLYRIHNQKLQYMYDYEKKLWRNASDSINNFTENFTITKLPKKKEFTDEELCILRNIDKKYKWIARDKVDRDEYDNYGNLNRYFGKHNKYTVNWLPSDEYCEFHAYNHLFQSIKWEDEEPVYIDDYVER